MNPEATFKENRKIYIILALIILTQLGTIIYAFQFKKEGTHSDELWLFGLANNYYRPNIFVDNDWNSDNIYEWVDGDEVRSYLTVDEGERFSYGSVYFNHTKDLSPPFHSMVLHTICSFFPGRMTLWFSFSINIVAFIVASIYLFRICSLMIDKKMALAICFVYGFTQGALDTYIYLRMYAMCTAMLMAIVYYTLVVVKGENDQKYLKNGIKLFVISFFAFFSHLYMVSTCGIMTALLCFYLLVQKKWKIMLKYGLTMAAAFGCFVLAFPYIFGTTTYRVSDVSGRADLNFEMRSRILISYFTKKITSFKIHFYTTNTLNVILACICVALILLSPLLFLFRNTKWVQEKKEKIIYAFKNFKVVIIGGTVRTIKNFNWIFIILVITGLCQIYVIGETTTIYAMGQCVDRYVFYLYPLYLMIFVSLVRSVLLKLIKNKKIVYVLLGGWFAFLIVTQQRFIYTDDDYFFEKYNDGERIRDLTKDKNVILIIDSKWTFTIYTGDIFDCKNVFVTDFESIKDNEKLIREKLEDETIVLINVDEYNDNPETDEKVAELDMKKTYANYMELMECLNSWDSDGKIDDLGTEEIYKKVIGIFRIN